MRRKLKVIISFSAILLFIAFSSVLYATNVLKSSPESSPESNIISLNVETDKPSYSPGEVVRIHALIKNIGEENITLGSLNAEYRVYDSSKTEVVPRIFAWIELVPKTISPQTEFRVENLFRWNTTDVAPGIYTIEVTLISPVKATTEIEVRLT